MTPDPAPAASWNRRHWLVLAGGLAVAALIRAALFPLPGLAGDMDEFATWVQGLTAEPFGQAYDRDLTFPPVMVYLWGALAVLVPAFAWATDASDPAVRIALKLLPTIADAGLVAGVAFALRGRPWWAVAGALSIALHPAVIDVSALFGQYESVYVLFGLGAYLLAIRNHSRWAVVVLALALMTKPQALPFLVPFGAWFVAREGWAGAARLAAIGAATIVVLWLPFVADGGPAGYVRSIALHQDDLFAVLSLRAWNPWWILQVVAADGAFVSDSVSIVGPVTLRVVGIVIAALLELVVFAAVLRRPTPTGLAWGLLAASLVAFMVLTTMHERYAYPALVFVVLLFPDRRAVALWAAFSLAFTLNLLAAVPPTPEVGAVLPVAGWLGIAGSVAMTAIALSTVVAVRAPVSDLEEHAL
ncbi:MAG: hypothetical protein AABZ33_01040 [Chloroflexota bacterium]